MKEAAKEGGFKFVGLMSRFRSVLLYLRGVIGARV